MSVGAGGGAVSGVAPVVVPDASGFVELAWTPSPGALFAPSFRAGFDYAPSGVAGAAGVTGAMTVARSVGTLGACPLRWASGPFRLAPCLEVEGGALSASGAFVIPVRTATRPWIAVGALARARYVAPFGLFVELSGGVHAPLERDRFYFEPNTTVFRPPAVSAFAAASLGFTIL